MKISNPQIELNKYGFYWLKNKPSPEELKEYYANKYYQQDFGSYEKEYSNEELSYINNKIEQKHKLFSCLLEDKKKPRLLDIGCGEGFCLSYFYDKKWDILGLDFSEYGILNHNTDLKPFLISGDIYTNIELLKEKREKFDVVWIDNVLEHVIDPEELLISCHKLTSEKGILVIEVPNDFSEIQLKLIEKGVIGENFWVAIPDHLSYFNKDGLTNICNSKGWKLHKMISDFPIDFNLFNPNANYINNKKAGKGAHIQRIRIENILHDISIDSTNQFYEALANLGLGRQIIGIFVKDRNEGE